MSSVDKPLIDVCVALWSRLKRRCRTFRSDTSGQIIIIFALSSVAIFAGVGAGIDLGGAYAARQRLSEVATLACQYSTRPSVGQTGASNYSGTNGFTNYVAAVNAFATASLTAQHWNASIVPTGANGNPGAYFTATPAAGGSTGNAAAAAPTNPVVEMSAVIPTAFSRILNIPSVTVHAKIACQTLATTPQIVNPPVLLSEGFETPCSGFCFHNPSGGSTTIATPTSTFPSTAGYIGLNGYSWYIVGYCVETDLVGQVNSSVPEGSHAAELDCENGSGNKGNSSISTKIYLEVGQYELRYFYKARTGYPDYAPEYVCGSTAGDLSWANSTAYSPGAGAFVPRTNQVNVYLDANLAGTNGTVGSAPLHTTLDGTQQLAGSNLIDQCVFAPYFVERSVRIKVTVPGYYWLSLAADGASDSYGGQIDNIRMCQEVCPGTVQDNFPPSWQAVNNGGVNKLLFEDTFENPVYTPDPYVSSAHSKGGNLASSVPVVSNLPTAPWVTAPYNEVVFWESGATQGNQYLSLQGWNGFSNSSDPINRAISRRFLLDPGYYNISYFYTSLMDFSYDFVYGINCTAAPTNTNNYSLYGTRRGYNYGSNTLYTQYFSTDFMDVFLSNGQLISTPNPTSTLGAAPMYTNPDGTTSSTPTVPPDNGSLYTAYNPSAVNPVIDRCDYSSNYVWVPRSVNVKITKLGYYWLTFSAQGDPLTGLGAGPSIDDVKLTALGSPYMAYPPAAPLLAIPSPNPQPDSSYTSGTYPGFTIVADPFTPPGADQ